MFEFFQYDNSHSIYLSGINTFSVEAKEEKVLLYKTE